MTSELNPRHDAPVHVDPAALHALIDELSVVLHEYVDTAVGVRSEFDAETAEDDPRIEAVEDRIAAINTRIDDRFEQDLGIASAHTAQEWDEDEQDVELDEGLVAGAVFEMGFVVMPGEAARDLDDALDVIQSGGDRIVAALGESGFDVREWGASRTDLDDEDDDV